MCLNFLQKRKEKKRKYKLREQAKSSKSFSVALITF